MSVQAGIWNFDGRPVDSRLIASFSELLKRQGPDGEFTYVDGSIALLYRPFHTTAESRCEKQPHISRRGFILTWDGRLDNRKDLIADLRSNLEADPTDVAIVAAAFEHWGMKCFGQLRGDWAVTIWNPQENRLIVAIDYVGIRHIFYHRQQRRLLWCTDLASLVLLSDGQFRIDEDYVAGYLATWPRGDLTPYHNVRAIPPGHFLSFHSGHEATKDRWWFPPTSEATHTTDDDYEDGFRCLLRQSVQRRLNSHAPVIAELSGGLDSSSIVCLADDVVQSSGPLRERLDTLSYINLSEPAADDWAYIRIIEQKRKRHGIHIDVSCNTKQPSLQGLTFVPEPGSLDTCYGPLDRQRSLILKTGGYRVVLSGIGGDEVLGGIADPSAQLADLLVTLRLTRLVTYLIQWSLAKRVPAIHLIGAAMLHLLPTYFGRYFARHKVIDDWVRSEFAKRTSMDRYSFAPSDLGCRRWLPSRRAFIGNLQAIGDMMIHLQRNPLVMEEKRYPYLDQDLIHFLLTIPASQLLRPGQRRSLLRRALRGIVPSEILLRRTKQTSARMPLSIVADHWEELSMAFGSPVCADLGFISAPLFRNKLEHIRDGSANSLVGVMRTISLELWIRDQILRGLIDRPHNDLRKVDRGDRHHN
jgi:asparagine synthase (glutamine-hydrolysing)